MPSDLISSGLFLSVIPSGELSSVIVAAFLIVIPSGARDRGLIHPYLPHWNEHPTQQSFLPSHSPATRATILAMAVYHVYILANSSGVLYTGITNYLERRVAQHKQKHTPGFTKKYAVTPLVYFQSLGDVRNAISREKQIKSWRREKKLSLIHPMNPQMRDLNEDSLTDLPPRVSVFSC